MAVWKERLRHCVPLAHPKQKGEAGGRAEERENRSVLVAERAVPGSESHWSSVTGRGKERSVSVLGACRASMTMGDDGDGEWLALSMYICHCFLFVGLKECYFLFFFFLSLVFRPSWKQSVGTYGLMNPLKGQADALRINILRKVLSPKLQSLWKFSRIPSHKLNLGSPSHCLVLLPCFVLTSC